MGARRPLMALDLREWLEADGLGGFAMGTASGVRTRGYHALLCAAARPPGGRMVLVNGLEVFVQLPEGRRLGLSSHRYRGAVIHPDGAQRLAGFTWDPWPRWEFLLEDGSRVVQEVLVARGAARVCLRWRRQGGDAPVDLSVRPLLSGRDYHSLHRENADFAFDAERRGRCIVWRPYPGVPAVVASATGDYRHDPEWYRGFVYSEEIERGLPSEEDLASPGAFAFDLSAGPAVLVLAAGEPEASALAHSHAAMFAERTFSAEAGRRASLGVEPLRRAADAYLVNGEAGETIIAGYPWFGDWGRDTFVALRGLCLSTKRFEDARRILLGWADALSEGMLPNRLTGPARTPEYNSVDAALWFVVAAGRWLDTPDAGTAGRREIEDAIEHVVQGYAGGTRHGIAAADDGLLRCGEPGTQLTWMDARVEGREITPRIGKPVEVQALWVNALAIAARREPRWRALQSRAGSAFAARFWNAGRHMLYDVVDANHESGRVDDRFRPNQIFAVGGLPLALVEGERARAVVDAVERTLWTPAGLRSLAPGEPDYVGLHRGPPRERDAAYHQGTVWTWLMGPFAEAWVRVRGGSAEVRREARRRFLDPLLAMLETRGLGHLGEIADGDPPHTPRGCPFQAWSVAEALRLDLDVLADSEAT